MITDMTLTYNFDVNKVQLKSSCGLVDDGLKPPRMTEVFGPRQPRVSLSRKGWALH